MGKNLNRKFILARTDAIGDTLLTLPMAQLLKERFPNCQVIFIISERTRDIFKKLDYVDRYYVLESKWSFFKKLFFLLKIFIKEKRIDGRNWYYLYVGGTHLPSCIAFLLRLPFRGGLLSRAPSFLFLNNGVRQRRSLAHMHETEYNLALLEPLNIEVTPFIARYIPSLNLSEEELQTSLSFLKESGTLDGREMILIHPGMMGHTLNWPMLSYLSLILQLEDHYQGRFQFVVSHTKADQAYIKKFREHVQELGVEGLITFYDGTGRSLRTYMALLTQAELFIGPSTGTTHLAAILAKRVISFYSPIKVQSALRWGPMGRTSKLITVMVPDVVCGEPKRCEGESCPYFECMTKIEVSEVFEEAITLLSRSKEND